MGEELWEDWNRVVSFRVRLGLELELELELMLWLGLVLTLTLKLTTRLQSSPSFRPYWDPI